MLNISGLQEGIVLDHIEAGKTPGHLLSPGSGQAGMPGSHHQKAPAAIRWDARTSLKSKAAWIRLT